MISIRMAKGNFFDSEKILKEMDQKTRGALSRGGAMVMREARGSIKDAAIKQSGRLAPGERRQIIGHHISRPGWPPRSRTGLLRQFILFSAERQGTSWGVVIGPARLNQHFSDAPHALEFGGASRVLTKRRKRLRDKRGRYTEIRESPELRTIHVQRHPYMGPALERLVASGRLPEQWKGATLGGG